MGIHPVRWFTANVVSTTMELDTDMALEIEMALTVNLSIEVDNPDVTEEEIKAAILTHPLSTFDMGECLKVTCNYGGPDLGYTDENSSVYANGVTNMHVDRWVVVEQTGTFTQKRYEPVYGDTP